MEEPAAATESSGTPSTIARSPLDFANENPSQQITGDDGTEDQVQEIVASEVPPLENVTTTGVALETDLGEEVTAMGPRVSKKCRKRGNDGADANAPPKVLRKDHAASRPTQSTAGGKSLISVGLETRSTFPVPAPQETLADTSNPDPLSYANRSYFPLTQIFQGSCHCWRSIVGEYLLYFHGRVTRKHIPARVGHDQRLSPGLGGPPSTTRFTDLQVSNDRLSQQVSTLQAQVTGEEKLKAVFEEFKKYEDGRVEKRCAEMDARLDALSIEFDEELYPHTLTAIAGCRWVIGHGLRLAGMSEGLKHGVDHEKASLDLEAIEAYDPEADTKYVAAFHALRDLKYLMVDQLESLKDALIDVIMASLHLESDSGEDAL
ncbi:hypothetical protein Tco_0296617 [Tanacetum coccineum]